MISLLLAVLAVWAGGVAAHAVVAAGHWRRPAKDERLPLLIGILLWPLVLPLALLRRWSDPA